MLAQCYEDYQQALTAHNWEHVREHYRWYVADAKWVLSCLLVFKASEWVADLRFERRDALERALIVPPVFVHVGVKADGTASRITDGDCHTITAAAYGFDMGGWSQEVTRLVRTSMEQCEFLFKPATMAISLVHRRNVSCATPRCRRNGSKFTGKGTAPIRAITALSTCHSSAKCSTLMDGSGHRWPTALCGFIKCAVTSRHTPRNRRCSDESSADSSGVSIPGAGAGRRQQTHLSCHRS